MIRHVRILKGLVIKIEAENSWSVFMRKKFNSYVFEKNFFFQKEVLHIHTLFFFKIVAIMWNYLIL